MEGTGRGPVVVVGAGIVGCAIAVHLADLGIRPVVVDPDRPAGSSFASLSAFGTNPAAYYELAAAGMAGWSRWAERLGGGVGLRRDASSAGPATRGKRTTSPNGSPAPGAPAIRSG